MYTFLLNSCFDYNSKLYDELKAADEERQAIEAAERAAADGDESSPSKDETASVTSGGGKKGKGSAKYVITHQQLNYITINKKNPNKFPLKI